MTKRDSKTSCFFKFYLATISLLIISLTALSAEAANVSLSPSITYANGTNAEAGGTSDGTTELPDGNTVQLVISNNGGGEAFNISATIDFVASEINILSSTVSLTSSTCAPAPTGVVYGGVPGARTLSFTPSGYDMPQGCNIIVEFDVEGNVNSLGGTQQLDINVIHSTNNNNGNGNGNGNTVTAQTLQDVQINRGAILAAKTPPSQTAAVGDTVSWDIEVSNTGLGGLFDVVVDESTINPSSALQITSISSAFTGVTVTADSATIPYLASGDTATITVEAIVTNCEGIENTAAISERTGVTNTDVDASVVLDLQTPLITYSLPAVSIPHGSTETVSTTVDNAGIGDAIGVTLSTNYDGVFSVNVTSPGWTYASGAFTYTGNGGTIFDSESIPLEYELTPLSNCGGEVIATNGVLLSDYEDTCDNVFAVPTELHPINYNLNSPDISINKSTPGNQVTFGNSATFDITISAINEGSLSTNNAVITDTLPSTDDVSVGPAPAGTSFSCPSDPCQPGEEVTWIVTPSALPGPITLPVNVSMDVVSCTSGLPAETFVPNTASVSTTSDAPASCPLSDSDDFTVLLRHGSGDTTSATGTLNGTLTPIAPLDDPNYYETGTPDNGDQIWQPGEGEFITMEGDYVFTADTGTWTGSNFSDNFGGLAGAQLVGVDINLVHSGGTFTINLPPSDSNITQSAGGFFVDLGFIGTAIGNDNIGNATLDLDYKFTISDSEILPGTSGERIFNTDLRIGGVTGCGVALDFANLLGYGRASAAVRSTGPAQVAVCEPFRYRMTVVRPAPSDDEPNPHLDPSNIQFTHNFGSDYVVTAATQAYSGSFNGADLPVVSGTGSDVYTYTNPNAGEDNELRSNTSFVDVEMILLPTAGGGATSFTPAPISTNLIYDNNQTFPAGARVFNDSTTFQPAIGTAAKLALTVSPQTFVVSGDTAQWTIFVTNVGPATATEVNLKDLIPTGLLPNAALTDAANASDPNISTVTVAGQEYSWTLADIAAGSTTEVTVITDVDAGGTCSITDGTNNIEAQWGCLGTVHQTVTKVDPNFIFPEARLEIMHDTQSTESCLCDETDVVVIIRNTSESNIFNVEVVENLNTATNGLTLSTTPDFEISTDAGATWSPIAISASNINATTGQITFNSTDIPELAELASVPNANGVLFSDIRVRFDIVTPESSSGATPTLDLTGSGERNCGLAASVPSNSYQLPVDEPNIRVTKTGVNTTAEGIEGTAGNLIDASLFANDVYAEPGDEIVWRIQINNSGDKAAQNVRLTDTLPAGVSNISLSPASTPAFSASGTVSLPDVPVGNTFYYLTTDAPAACADDVQEAEFTWGCVDNGATTPSNLTLPTATNTANLNMPTPGVGSSALNVTQTFTTQNSSETLVRVEVTNTGGVARFIRLTENLPDNFNIVTSTNGNVWIDGVSVGTAPVNVLPTTDPNDYELDLTAFTLFNNEVLAIEFTVQQTNHVDATEDEFINPETESAGNSLDPDRPISGINFMQFDASNACGPQVSAVSNANFDPQTPDIDFIQNPPAQLATVGDTYNISWVVINNGDANSIADNIAFDLTSIDPNLTVNSLTVAGITPSCASTSGCTAAEIGNITGGGAVAIIANVTYSTDSGGAILPVEAQIRGDFAVSGDDYSLDTSRTVFLPINFDKALTSTSETFTADPNLAIGEEVTYTVNFTLPDMNATSTLSAIQIRDTLPAGLGLVSATATGNNTVTIASTTVDGSAYTLGTTNASVIDDSVINFNVANLNNVSGNVFEVEIVARVLQAVSNTDGSSKVNNAGSTFTYDDTADSSTPATYSSDNATDGLGGSESALHDDVTMTIVRPQLTVDKQVRNVTDSGTFADAATGDAGDIIEYRFVVTNSSTTAPLFNIEIDDAFSNPNKIIPQDNTAIANSLGADTTGDNVVDNTSTAAAITSPSTVHFDEANTAIASASPEISLARLDNGETITLLYRAQVQNTVNPSEIVGNDVDVTGSSLPGSLGDGTNSDLDGELVLEAEDNLDVTIFGASSGKTVTATSIADTTNPNVVIGEQITYQIQVVVPEGTIPDLEIEDAIPANLQLVSTPAVTIGSAISGGQPTISPAALPVNGAITLTYDFDGRTVTPMSSVTDRTITITYVTQVLNIAANNSGATISNAARHTTNGGTTYSPQSTVNLTTVEAILDIQKTASPTSGFDAGDTITYTFVVNNTGNAPAYEVTLEDTADTKLTFDQSSFSCAPHSNADYPTANEFDFGDIQGTPQHISIPANDSLTCTVDATVNDTVEPSETLENDVTLTAESIPDTAPRTDATDGNDDGTKVYTDTDDADIVSANNFNITKLVPSGTADYRIGDLIVYSIIADFQEGTTDNVIISDTLPAGLEITNIVVSPASGNNGFTYTVSSAPAIGDTGAISWNFGTVVNAGDADTTNDFINIVLTAQVMDIPAITATPTTQTLTNDAELNWDEEDGTDKTDQSDVDIDVIQPNLSITKSVSSPNVGADGTVDYTITVANTGDAPAYDVIVEDTIPLGMEDATPTIVTSTIGGSAVSLTLNYTGAPVITFATASTDPIPAGDSLVITYRITANSDVGAGLTLTNSAEIDSSCSLPSTDANAAECREYTDGPVDVDVTTPSPTDITKAVDATTANVGETFTYTLTIPGTAIDAHLHDVVVTDTLPTGLEFIAVNVVSAGTTFDAGLSNLAENFVMHIDEIEPNEQAVLEIQVRVNDEAGNVTGTTFNNQASYTWTGIDGGTAEPSINSNTVTTTVTDPELVITKALDSITYNTTNGDLQSGDIVTYEIEVTNTGDGPAYQIIVDDIAEDHLDAPTANITEASGTVRNNVIGVSQGASGGNETWRWNLLQSVPAGESATLLISFTVDNSVNPEESLSNVANTSWSSTVSDNPDTRDENTADTPPVNVDIAGFSITKAELGDGTYNIGEDINYRIIFTTAKGTLINFSIFDNMPANMEFVSATITPTNLQDLGGATLTTVSAPTAGATGTLEWDFGDIETAVVGGAIPQIQIDAVIRITAGDSGDTFDNTASAQDDSLTEDSPEVTVTLTEPELTLTKDLGAGQATTVNAGDTVNYVITVENTGDGNAFAVEVSDTLPAEVTDITPTLVSATLAGVAITPTLDFTATPILTFTLPTGTEILPGTANNLVIEYQATVDLDVGPNQTITNSARIEEYYSADPTNPDTEQYPPTTPDSESVDTPDFTGGITKIVDNAEANIGDVITYTITVPDTAVNIALHNVTVTDAVPTSLEVLSATVTSSHTLNGSSVMSGNNISAILDILPPTEQLVIEVQARVNEIPANDTTITVSNEASFTYTETPTGTPEPPTDSPPVETELTEPNISILKTLDNITYNTEANNLQAGDEITYRLVVTNTGDGTLYNPIVTDTANVDLISPIADVTEASGAVNTAIAGTAGAGTGEWTWNLAEEIPASGSATVLVTFTVANTAQPFEQLENDASVTGTSTATNNPDTRDYSDNNDTPVIVTTGDITINKEIIGDTTYTIGEDITYRITFDAIMGLNRDVVISDFLPTGLEYRSHTFTSTNLQAAGGGAVAISSAPTLGDTGTIVFDFDDIEAVNNSGADPILALDIIARVLDVPTNIDGTTLTNSAQLDMLLQDGTPFVTATPGVDADIIEPELTIVKALATGQATEITANQTVNYALTITNIGNSPAFDINLQDTLPNGLQDSTPTLVSATINGATLAVTIDYTGTPIMVFNYDGAIGLDPTQTLEIEYQVTANADIGAGLSLDNIAQINSYGSLPEDSNNDEIRTYDPVGPVSTTVTTPSPTDMGKTGDLANANIGDTVTYTLTIPQTPVNVALHDLTVIDNLPAGLDYLSFNVLSSHTVNTGLSSLDETLELRVDLLEASGQFVVEVLARVENLPANADGAVLTNQASYTYAQDSGEPQQPPIDSPPVDTTITEPDLDITKALNSIIYNTENGVLQAGDQVVYDITINNNGTGTAYQVIVDDIADTALDNPTADITLPSSSASAVSGVSQGITGTAPSEVETWRWLLTEELDPTESASLQITFTVGTDVQPLDSLPNLASTDWSSTPTDNPETRDNDGDNPEDDYGDDTPTPVVVNAGGIDITKAEVGDGTYNIGEDVTYRITFDSVKGTINNVIITDALPTGLKYISNSFTSTNVAAVGGGALALIAEPTLNDTGSLTFNFGNLATPATAGTDPNPQIVLDIVARIVNNSLVDSDTPSNTASLSVDDETGNPVTDISDPVVVEVEEPSLVLALDGPSTVETGEPDTYTITINHDPADSSTAYNPTVHVQIPPEMCDADPTVLGTPTVTVAGTALVAGTDYTVTWLPTPDCRLEFEITTELDITEDLVITYESEVNDNTPDGTTITPPEATITQYHSYNSGDEIHDYDTPLGTGTDGTPNATIGDDANDDHPFVLESPVITVTKVVDQAVTTPGSTLTYTIVVTNSGNAQADDMVLTDTLPPEFVANTLALVSTTPDPLDGSSTTAITGNTITITDFDIPANSTAEIVISGLLPPVMPSTTEIFNQADLEIENYDDEVSDDPSRDDGTDTDGDGSTDDDDPTLTVIESAPIIEVDKNSERVPNDGSSLSQGDTLRYTISVRNLGDEHAINSVVTDNLPANTEYVANTTTLDGTPVADISGDSALFASDGVALGTVQAQACCTPTPADRVITFDVIIVNSASPGTPLPPGTIIANQATFDGEGEGDNDPVTEPSDDPDTPTEDDPTVDIVGDAPVIEAYKASSIDTVNREIHYTITVTNIGNVDSVNTIFTDTLPSNVTYVTGSTLVDGSSVADNVSGSVLTHNIGTLAVGTPVVIEFDISYSASLPAGTTISNQGLVQCDNCTSEPTDDPDTPTEDDPTIDVIGDGAFIVGTKDVADLNGGILNVGDTVEYTIILTNIGTEDALNVDFSDPGPAPSMNYVAGTFKVNGGAYAGGSSTLPSIGIVPIGTIPTGSFVTIKYRMVVPSQPSGTIFANQGTFDYTDTSGDPKDGVTDSDINDGQETGNDPSDPNDDDPELVQIGGVPGRAGVQGTVWFDTDHDRQITGGENFGENWIVELHENGTLVGTTTTDANGEYQFLNLNPSPDYEIIFKHPDVGTVWGRPQSGDADFGGTDSIPDGTIVGPIIDNLPLLNGIITPSQDLPIDPNGVVYDSILRNPVPGAIVTLLDSTGNPVPAGCLFPGQQAQTTAADGYYQFDLLPSCPLLGGTFTIDVTPPPGFIPTFPSAIIPPQTTVFIPPTIGVAVIQPQNTHPTGTDMTDYYPSMQISANSANIVNNHLPIDPILEGSVIATKETPKSTVTVGDLVPYTLTFLNTLPANLPNMEIVDIMPPFFTYVAGSAKIDGVATEPNITNGTYMEWQGLTLPANGTITVTLILRVGSGADMGDHVNTTYMKEGTTDTIVSNNATAVVQMIPDPVFDCSDLIGHVYYDLDADGYYDGPEDYEDDNNNNKYDLGEEFEDDNENGIWSSGEIGMPKVRVALPTGEVATTDSEGRYHFECVSVPDAARGSNVIVKLDMNSVPDQWVMTSENPRVVRATRGKMIKANFALGKIREITLDIDDRVFDECTWEIDQNFEDDFDTLVHTVIENPAHVRIVYRTKIADTKGLPKERVNKITSKLRQKWRDHNTGHELTIREEIIYTSEPLKPNEFECKPSVRQFIIYFPFDKYYLDSEALNIVADLESYVKQDRTRKMYLSGHTDTMGTDRYNINLSKNRVDEVREKIKSLGLGNNVSTSGYEGERRNYLNKGNQYRTRLNRRVEVIVK